MDTPYSCGYTIDIGVGCDYTIVKGMGYNEDEFENVIGMIKRGVLKELESEKDA